MIIYIVGLALKGVMTNTTNESAGAYVKCKYCKNRMRVRSALLEYQIETKRIQYDWVCHSCYILAKNDSCDYRDFNGYYIHIHRPICEQKIRESKFEKNVLQRI
jgi:hypothetical protein